MIIKRKKRKIAWYLHKKDCYCNTCFKHKCIKRNKKRKQDLGIDYFEYILSDLWRDRKDRYYKKYKKICRACGTPHSIDLHHMIYGIFGKEPDRTLVPLCRVCHDEYHKIYKGRNSIDNTKYYIKIKQENIRKFISTFKSIDKKN